MSNSKIVIDYAGIGQLLKSPEMASMLQVAANQVLARANASCAGYEAAPPHDTGQRVAINIYAESSEAKSDNSENNTLLKAIGR